MIPVQKWTWETNSGFGNLGLLSDLGRFEGRRIKLPLVAGTLVNGHPVMEQSF